MKKISITALVIIILLLVFASLFIFRFIGTWENFMNDMKSRIRKRNSPISNLERKQKIKDLVAKIVPVIEKGGVNIWAEFGTLLGIIRGGDVICYDYDADFCTLSRDWPILKKVLRKFMSENKDYDWGFVDLPLIKNAVVRNKKTGAYMDIAVRGLKGSKTYRKVPLFEKEIPFGAIFPLQRRKLPETDIYISLPCSPPVLLRSWYGDNYMIPDKKCDEECESCVKNT